MELAESQVYARSFVEAPDDVLYVLNQQCADVGNYLQLCWMANRLAKKDLFLSLRSSCQSCFDGATILLAIGTVHYWERPRQVAARFPYVVTQRPLF